MFQTTLTHLIMWNLVALLGILALIWAWKVARREIKERRSLKARFACGVCGTPYYDSSPAQLVECPRCGRLNERGMVLEI
jgi:hypothetical protein